MREEHGNLSLGSPGVADVQLDDDEAAAAPLSLDFTGEDDGPLVAGRGAPPPLSSVSACSDCFVVVVAAVSFLSPAHCSLPFDKYDRPITIMARSISSDVMSVRFENISRSLSLLLFSSLPFSFLLACLFVFFFFSFFLVCVGV